MNEESFRQLLSAFLALASSEQEAAKQIPTISSMVAYGHDALVIKIHDQCFLVTVKEMPKQPFDKD